MKTNFVSARVVCTAALALCAPVALAHPGCGIVVADGGDVYFMDTGHGVWKIDKQGRMTSCGTSAGHFLILDRAGAFAQRDFSVLEKGDVVVHGPDPNLLVGTSYPIAIGTDGAFYYPNVKSKGRVRIMRMVAGKPPKEFVVLPTAKEVSYEGKEITAEWIWGLAAGPNGSLYYTEKRAVRRVGPDGTVSTVAENVTVPDCEKPPSVDNDHVLPGLYGLAVSPDGTVYVAASACSAVLKITPEGNVSVALRATDRWSPQGIALDGDMLYVLEYDYIKTTRREDWLPRVRKLSPDGTITVVARVEKR